MIDQDEFPHPVPLAAKLLWKENWWFAIHDKESNVFGFNHISLEPVRGKGRFTGYHLIDGTLEKYGNEIEINENVQDLKEVSDGRLTYRVIEPQKRFKITFQGDKYDMELNYQGRFNVFDFRECMSKQPNSFHLHQAISTSRHLPFDHIQQSLRLSGHIEFKEGDKKGERKDINCLAYRDHSWGFRSELINEWHYWLWMNFEDKVAHVCRLKSLASQYEESTDGYIGDSKGNVVLKSFDIKAYPERHDSKVEKLSIVMEDIKGNIRTLVCLLSESFCIVDLPLHSPDANFIYETLEYYCEGFIEETGEKGSGVVEIAKRKELKK